MIGVDGVNWGGVGSVCEIGSICSVCEIGSICDVRLVLLYHIQ